MRITGGKARGILLQTPKGDSTRPATDRTREAVFSSLGTQIEGSVCVDLLQEQEAMDLKHSAEVHNHASFLTASRKPFNA